MRSRFASVVLLAAVVSVSSGSVRHGVEPRLVTHDVRLEHVTSDRVATSRVPARTSATWCGAPVRADLRPNVISGSPVHWIYVLPADAPDRFSTFASLMQTDAETIDAWWRERTRHACRETI